MKIFTPFALKLHAYALNKLFDSNWIYGEFSNYFWDLTQSNREYGLFQKTIKKGVLYLLGCLVFGNYVDLKKSKKIQSDYPDDLYAVLKCADINIEGIEMRELSQLIATINSIEVGGIYSVADTEQFQSYLIETLQNVTVKFLDQSSSKIQDFYALNYADRVFHDRQLCEHISLCISESMNEKFEVSIEDSRGYVKDQFEGLHPYSEVLPKPWISRKKWPKWASELLQERDGRKCCECGNNLGLNGKKSNVDHIIPLNLGGTNDLVNLQLLCETCNKQKKAYLHNVNSSIPRYLTSVNSGANLKISALDEFVSSNPLQRRWVHPTHIPNI